MKFLIIGDVHGSWHALNRMIAKAMRQHSDITHIVQVGDFSYGWPGTKPFKASRGFFTGDLLDRYHAVEKLWLDGNHENFDQLEKDGGAWQPGWTYMPRGSVLEVDGYRMMFFGGASSIDKAYRIEGKSWWPQETIKYGEVMAALETEGDIHAIFSHEHPYTVPYSDERHGDEIFGIGDKRSLEALREHFRPKHWFFGHHHAFDQGTVGRTKWYCCPIVESYTYIIWTGDKAWTEQA